MIGKGRKVAWKYRRLEYDYRERRRNQWKREMLRSGRIVGFRDRKEKN